jgi:hypothetical protein
VEVSQKTQTLRFLSIGIWEQRRLKLESDTRRTIALAHIEQSNELGQIQHQNCRSTLPETNTVAQAFGKQLTQGNIRRQHDFLAISAVAVKGYLDSWNRILYSRQCDAICIEEQRKRAEEIRGGKGGF